jgi:hypothetical protein
MQEDPNNNTKKLKQQWKKNEQQHIKNPNNNARKLNKLGGKKTPLNLQRFNTQNKLINKNGAQTFYGVSRGWKRVEKNLQLSTFHNCEDAAETETL